jgi:hypothetical protein
MTTYGSDDGSLTYATKDMSDHITEYPSLSMENETEDSTTLGSGLSTEAYTGLTKYGSIQVGGPLDDTATTGPEAVFGGAAAAKSYAALVLGFGGAVTKTFSLVGVRKYEHTWKKGARTGYTCELFVGAGCEVS